MSKSSKNSSKPISETDKAYIAGFIDGEGSIGLYIQKPSDNHTSYRLGFRFLPQVTIFNTNRPVLDDISEKYKGGLTLSRKRKRGNKTYWELRFGSRKLIKILTDVLPYLKIKKIQAELLLEFYKLPPFKPPQRSDETLRRMIDIYNKLKVLNTKGNKKPKLLHIKHIRKHRQKIEIRKSQLKHYIQQGLSLKDIAKKIGCHPETVRRRIKKFGIN